jgi:hypothetical protein
LQETSCHSLEVTRIDDIFQDTFERDASVNHFAFHTITPLVSLPVNMYASSRNVLTGVIESPDTLGLIAKLYSHSLVWYSLKYFIAKGMQEHKSDTQQQEQSIPTNVTFLSVDNPAELQPSSSIEAVNLDSWPSSEQSPEQVTLRLDQLEI